MKLTHNNDTCIHPCGLQISVLLGTTELLQSDHINHRCNLCLVPPAVITAPIPERMMVHWSSLMWGNVRLVSDIKRLVCREGDRPFMTCGPNKNNYCNFNGFVCYSGLTEVDQPIMLSHTEDLLVNIHHRDQKPVKTFVRFDELHMRNLLYTWRFRESRSRSST